MKSPAVLLVVALALTLAKQDFDRCSLARELDHFGVPRPDLAHWTCIAERVSSYRISAVSPTNADGSNSYGIFQLSSLYWCDPGDGRFSHNACKINCAYFLTGDIFASVVCARFVKDKQGWGAWPGCDGILPSIDDCF